MRDIEDELGADLFLREPAHGARLTGVGRAFLSDVREMFGNLDRAKMTAQAVAYGKRGRLRLAAFRKSRGSLNSIGPYIAEQLKANDRFRVIFTSAQSSRIEVFVFDAAEVLSNIESRVAC